MATFINETKTIDQDRLLINGSDFLLINDSDNLIILEDYNNFDDSDSRNSTSFANPSKNTATFINVSRN